MNDTFSIFTIFFQILIMDSVETIYFSTFAENRADSYIIFLLHQKFNA